MSLKRQEWNWTARAQTGGDGNNHNELLQSSKHFPAGSKRKHAFIIVGAIVNIYSPFICVYYTQKNKKYNSTNDKIGCQQYRYVRYINSSQIEVKLAVQNKLKYRQLIKYSQILTFARNKNNGIEIWIVISAPTTVKIWLIKDWDYVCTKSRAKETVWPHMIWYDVLEAGAAKKKLKTRSLNVAFLLNLKRCFWSWNC